MKSKERRLNYNCDITYTNNSVSFFSFCFVLFWCYEFKCFFFKKNCQIPCLLSFTIIIFYRSLVLIIYGIIFVQTENNLLWGGKLLCLLTSLVHLVWIIVRFLALIRPNPFHFAIVDEVDSVLIDEGRNPLLISGEVICVPIGFYAYYFFIIGDVVRCFFFVSFC